MTLFAAGTGAPAQLAQGKSDDTGAFKLTYTSAPADGVLYLVAKGGTPKAGKGASESLALLALLGKAPSTKVMVNEFTTVASAFTAARFIQGEAISGNLLGLRIAAMNVPNLVNLQTGGWGIRHHRWAQHHAQHDAGEIQYSRVPDHLCQHVCQR